MHSLLTGTFYRGRFSNRQPTKRILLLLHCNTALEAKLAPNLNLVTTERLRIIFDVARMVVEVLSVPASPAERCGVGCLASLSVSSHDGEMQEYSLAIVYLPSRTSRASKLSHR